jgi:cysteine desulfurase family protein
VIYLDHAATSWPKPPEVVAAVTDFMERAGGNPGRSGHRLSVEAGRIVYGAREAVADLFKAPDPLRVVFTHNVTHAINGVLHGLLQPGDRAVTTSVEHNAVMRPLRALERSGVRVTVVPCAPDGSLEIRDMETAIGRDARLVVVTHASNVTGTVLPIDEIARLAHRAGALVLVDAAQTAGVVPIDVQALDVDFLAFTGHKGLQGPPGTGGVVIGARVDGARLDPLVRGGTGSHSEHEEQPEDLPDRFESGTPNGAGLAGLGAGIGFVTRRGVEAIRAHEVALTGDLVKGLGSIRGVRVHGPADPWRRTAVVPFTVEGRRVSDVGFALDEEHGILCRVGLHCAPAAHRTLGTFPEGAVRLAPGPLTTRAEIDATLQAIERIVAR